MPRIRFSAVEQRFRSFCPMHHTTARTGMRHALSRSCLRHAKQIVNSHWSSYVLQACHLRPVFLTIKTFGMVVTSGPTPSGPTSILTSCLCGKKTTQMLCSKSRIVSSLLLWAFFYSRRTSNASQILVQASDTLVTASRGVTLQKLLVVPHHIGSFSCSF